MKTSVLERLCCAVCQQSLTWRDFASPDTTDLQDGVAWCSACGHWYPIEDGVLELLPPELAYTEHRQRFWTSHERCLRTIGLDAGLPVSDRSAVAAQQKQQRHFDWYAENEQQTYDAYEQMPFWRAVDARIFAEWHQAIQPGGWLLDVGCAQGRSSFPFMDLPIQILAFDISRTLVRRAAAHYRRTAHRADATFLVADASKLPLRAESVDYVLLYGVLHHLSDPAQTCRDVTRVLREDGRYFGCENNRTVLRAVFDLVQRLRPAWHEEAGAQPLISADEIRQWFAGGRVEVECDTRVFVPPHLVNWLGRNWGGRLLELTDTIAAQLPGIRNQGGLIMIRGRKRASVMPAPMP